MKKRIILFVEDEPGLVDNLGMALEFDIVEPGLADEVVIFPQKGTSLKDTLDYVRDNASEVHVVLDHNIGSHQELINGVLTTIDGGVIVDQLTQDPELKDMVKLVVGNSNAAANQEVYLDKVKNLGIAVEIANKDLKKMVKIFQEQLGEGSELKENR